MLYIICGVFFVFYFFMRLSNGITRSSSCLVGKTAIVTGANSGIGYQTALNLASRGCRVIMADVADMQQSKSNIIKYTSNTNIVAKTIDLCSFKSVREFAADVVRTEKRLDILINNAGIGASEMKKTQDGFHPVMQINYFSHFLLTHLLIDLLKKSAPSRIVFTVSLLAFTNNLSLSNLNYDEVKTDFFTTLFIYSNSKLATIVASDIFAEKLKGTGITSNSVHPGIVRTSIFDKVYLALKNIFLVLILRFIVAFFSKDSWEGSQTQIHVAISKKLENTTGKFFVDCRPFLKPRSAYNREWCRKIWEASERYVGLEENEKI